MVHHIKHNQNILTCSVQNNGDTSAPLNQSMSQEIYFLMTEILGTKKFQRKQKVSLTFTISN